MKNIINLTGVQKLSKKEQQDIKGSWGRRVYCKGPRQCCFRLANGSEFCDYGYCQSNGSCMWA
ncbi:hypothetical protein ATE84_3743 [Aquimarina sp. MAR_2010_214]|uniref:hypothetical protein n=1 Tax=Aquimarina sp. MAR_2010_214 TaxID=1250026 RepID=UPI000C704BAF|nr:hypothetical protein [Aquimarina sp. MAR_2010_214]PKV51653.1 hypothetical protein ATE84_3743 [Aquimarina sp. MAR_2010_214]